MVGDEKDAGEKTSHSKEERNRNTKSWNSGTSIDGLKTARSDIILRLASCAWPHHMAPHGTQRAQRGFLSRHLLVFAFGFCSEPELVASTVRPGRGSHSLWARSRILCSFVFM